MSRESISTGGTISLSEIRASNEAKKQYKPRRVSVDTIYNGKAITTTLGSYQTAFTYTDPASGESDTLSITIADPKNIWISAWLPHKGDSIQSTIMVQNQTKAGDLDSLNCGAFTIDDLSYSRSSSGNSFSIAAVSAPASDAFQATQRTQTWENVTLQKVAQTIASRYNLALFFDAGDVTIATQEQSNQTDSSFLATLCEDYGRFCKVYANKLVIFDREAYKKKSPAATIRVEDTTTFSWKTSLEGSYTGGTISYTAPDSDEDYTYSTGGGKRILSVNTKADGWTDATLKLKAALDSANHSITTISFTTMGRTDIVASQTITFTGVGNLSGKYYIDKKTDSVSGSGYTSAFECSLVESGSNGVIADALDRLCSLDVINSPDYWLSHYEDVPYLNTLIINSAAVIRTNSGGSSYTGNVSAALDRLVECGVINSKAYWAQNYTRVAYLDRFIWNCANAL